MKAFVELQPLRARAIGRLPSPLRYDPLIVMLVMFPPVFVALFGPLIAIEIAGGTAACVWLVQSTFARLAALLLGAILTFQSESNVLKLGFLALVLVSVSFAIQELLRIENSGTVTAWRPFIIASAYTLTYLLLTGPLAITRGTSLVDWARDVSPFLFAVSLPVVGIEAGLKLPSRVILRLFLLVGIVSTSSFVLQWLTNRGVISVGRITYGDNYLTASLFCICVAVSTGGKHRIMGIFAAATVFGASLLTGNRSLLVLALGFLAAIGAKSRLRLTLGQAAMSMLLLVFSLGLIAQLAIAIIPGEKALLSQRVEVTRTYLHTGQDQSARSRSRQNLMARDALSHHLVFGTAPGYRYTDPFFIPGVSDPHRNRGTFFNLDTPISLPAKFGLVGTLIIVFWLRALALCLYRWLHNSPPTIIATALKGFALVGIGFIPFGITIEQKGFSIAVMLFVAAVISETSARPAASFSTQSSV